MTCLMTESGRRYGPTELALAEELARRAALAVDNTRLYRAAQAGLAREQALRTAAEKLAAQQEAILRQIADGVVLADGAGRITFVNEAARRHFGQDLLPESGIMFQQQDYRCPDNKDQRQQTCNAPKNNFFPVHIPPRFKMPGLT